MLNLFSSAAIIICVAKLVFAGDQKYYVKCKANEVVSPCVNRVCEYRKCSDIGQPVKCAMMDLKYCIKGCVCKDKYLRAYDGTCVPANQCPNALKCPKPNEYYDSCPPKCPSRTCGMVDSDKCPEILKVGDPRCPPPACRCTVGFYRDIFGNCVTWNLCKKCEENEVPTTCFEAVCERRNCSDYGQPILCVRKDPKYCTNGCLCKDTYLRAENGTCVPADQCPNIQCGDNEVYDICPPQCPGEKCGTDPSSELCLPNPKPGDPSCKPGCRCCDNYLRNDYGYCVPKEQCLVCPGQNEIPGCKDPCPQTCDSIGVKCKQSSNVPNKQPMCIPECRCKDGFYRNKIGDCISKEECLMCTGPNEYFSCGGACDNECSTLNFKNQTNCPIINIMCNRMCYCEEGYARDNNNICIPISKCPKPTCGINEEYDTCLSSCPPRRCDVDDRLIKCKPLEYGDPNCGVGCRCADNFYRNDKNICVPRNQCPKKPPVCGRDEVYSSCVNGGCGRWNCSQPEDICVLMNNESCQEGCRCKQGMLRDDNGTCIPADQCPPVCTGENEIAGCQDLTCPQTCESMDIKCRQPQEYPYKKNICIPECRCKDGFYRNKIGECISKENCLKCTGPNEYYSCGGFCDNICATLYKQNQTNCPYYTFVCTKMCYCEKGYARDNNNICVPIAKCPQPTCGINEVYDTCLSSCPPRTCDAAERLIKCAQPLKPGDPKCKAGCRCADNFYKNDKDVCVPKYECPGICGPDEEYNSCVNGGCGRWNCSQPVEICIDLIKGACREGCRCKEGLLRADDGKCIPADECPLICSGKNEVAGCQDACPQTCESIGNKCMQSYKKKMCTPECRCKEGFYKNKIGECISEQNCMKCTGRNEYFACGGVCDNVCSTLNIQNQTNCPYKNSICNEMCYCEEGYARNYNKICIPISQCAPPRCGANEAYSTCPPLCPPERCDVDPRLILCTPNPKPGDPDCEPGCRCIDNYLRNKLGICIPKQQCPKAPPATPPTTTEKSPYEPYKKYN